MIWRWVTCFSLAAAAWAANVSGRVELSTSKDYSGVVVWLEPVSGAAPETAPATVTVAHKNKTFVPHVVVVRVGSKVAFPNLDPFFHNAFSNYDGQVFDLGLRPPHSSPEVTFRRPGIVRLFCNIHPTMSAVIAVLETPWFAVSDAKGAFQIGDVPAGEYRLRIFHERALADVLHALEHNVTIFGEDAAIPAMAISETGYIAPPHKNKYGKEYPAIIVDQYPGGRRP
jgi:plastocyanin